MKHSILLTAVTLFAAAVASAADNDDLKPNLPDPDAPVEVRVTSGEAGKEVKAKVGETVVVELDGNATTGYTWSEMPGLNDSVLESKGNEYVARQRPGMVGGGGKAYFRYLVKAPGTAEIKLGYARPWEKENPPARLFNVKIVAEAAAAPAGKTVQLEAKDSGGTYTLNVGDTIRVSLRSNRTTGYSWAENKEKTDAKVLKSDGGSYETNPHPEGMVGVGGVETWTFTALAPGKTEIVLGYARPWEKGKEPAQTFKTTVVVEAASAAPPTAGSDAKAAPATAKKEIRLGDDDNGKIVEVAAGGAVILTLRSNPTTGFSWTKADKVNSSILKQEKNEYKQNANPGGMVGVGGRTTIVYRAVKPGTAKIDLTYMQPWEPDSEFNTDYTVTVKVVE